MKETIGIKNIKTQQKSILLRIFRLAESPDPKPSQVKLLSDTIKQCVKDIEEICTSLERSPFHLTKASKQVYGWMKYLTNDYNLQQHLKTTHQLKEISLKILKANSNNSANVVIELISQSLIYRSNRTENKFHMFINEGFIHANEKVLEAVVKSILFGKNEKRFDIIRDYSMSQTFGNVIIDIDLFSEEKSEHSKGRYYDLDILFDKINLEYFAKKLAKPRLKWSFIQNYREFGHYEFVGDRVVLSLSLDDITVPQYVVEFVLYHELLHKIHGTKMVNGRQMVHTTEFRRDERKFKFYNEAELWLDKFIYYAQYGA
jgi:hypothetical protein